MIIIGEMMHKSSARIDLSIRFYLKKFFYNLQRNKTKIISRI